jgi:hypothetical protein
MSARPSLQENASRSTFWLIWVLVGFMAPFHSRRPLCYLGCAGDGTHPLLHQRDIEPTGPEAPFGGGVIPLVRPAT